MHFEQLERVAHVIAGQSPPGNSYNEIGEGLPFFQGKAEFGDVHPVASKWCTDPKKIAEAGDILISVRAPVGPTNLADQRCCIGRGLAAIRPNREKVDRDFLHWALRWRTPELIWKGQGSTFHAIAQKDLKGLAIPLPPLKEQRRIVDILNRAASIERLRASASTQLRALIPALFIKMFGDPITNPMGWETMPLGETTTLVQYGTSKKASETGEGVPVLRMGNVSYDGHLDCSDLKYVELEPKEVAKYRLQAGDILFNRTNSKDLVGKTGVWDDRFEAVPASYFIHVRLNPDLICPAYVGAFMNTPQLKSRLYRMAKGAIGQANINAKELKSIQIPVPPLDRQERYADLVTRIQEMIGLLDRSAEEAQALSKSLMARLFDPTEVLSDSVERQPEHAAE